MCIAIRCRVVAAKVARRKRIEISKTWYRSGTEAIDFLHFFEVDHGIGSFLIVPMGC